jgi:hypothetical protein
MNVAKSKTILKYSLSILGGICTFLIIVFIVAGYYDKPKGPSELNYIRKLENENINSEVMQKLNNYEKENNYNQITSMLINDISKFNAQEDMLIISWLLNRETNGKLPYYYFATLYFAKNKKTIECYNLMQLAMLTARIDNAKCNDPSSFQAYAILESLIFKPIIQSLEKNRMQKLASKMWALAYEEKIKDRNVATWICSHGMGAFTGSTTPLDPGKWETKRDEIRKEFMSH